MILTENEEETKKTKASYPLSKKIALIGLTASLVTTGAIVSTLGIKHYSSIFNGGDKPMITNEQSVSFEYQNESTTSYEQTTNGEITPMVKTIYSVPSGYTLICEDGKYYGVKKVTTTIAATVSTKYIDDKLSVVYTAPSGYTLSGKNAYKTEIERIPAMARQIYVLPENTIEEENSFKIH